MVRKRNETQAQSQKLGRRAGGLARAKKLSAKRRFEIAQAAAIARWGKRNG